MKVAMMKGKGEKKRIASVMMAEREGVGREVLQMVGNHALQANSAGRRKKGLKGPLAALIKKGRKVHAPP